MPRLPRPSLPSAASVDYELDRTYDGTSHRATVEYRRLVTISLHRLHRFILKPETDANLRMHVENPAVRAHRRTGT